MNAQRSKTQTRLPQKNSIYALRVAMVVALATALAFVFACGGSEESEGTFFDSRGERVVETVVVEKLVEVEVEKEVTVGEVMEAVMMAESDAAAAPAAAATPASAAAAAPAMAEEFGESVDISLQPQTRIIVRNADMIVQSNDPVATVDVVGDLAVQRGGWVVSSNTSDHGFYHITIRIPAETLDTVIEQIEAIVDKVESVTSDSTDFTEEYIDLGARRTTVQETVEALTVLLKSENYDSVEELLAVQREITNWQSELERIDGRMSFISESAAFSRLSVNVNRSPMPMRVDVGEDIHTGIGVGRKYTARFFPPEGYDYHGFEITWDFGDGSDLQTVYTGLRTQDEEGLLSVPVRHTYFSDEFSPHVVTVSVRAFSDRGLAEGEDQLWANVSELPLIDAFITASEYDVEEGQPVTLTASFNHPETLRNVQYEWDFRDGSKAVTGTVSAGETSVEIDHVFERYRPESYRVVFEIRGDSDAGEVEEIREVYISVYPAPAVESSDFDAGGTATNATNLLITVITFAGTAAIWLGITSPIWIIAGAIIYAIVRFVNRQDRKRQHVVYVPGSRAENEDAPEQQRSSTGE